MVPLVATVNLAVKDGKNKGETAGFIVLGYAVLMTLALGGGALYF